MSVINEVLYELGIVKRELEIRRKLRGAERRIASTETFIGMERRLERVIDLLQRLPNAAPLTREELEVFGWRLLYPPIPDDEDGA